jgi:PAS domain-containing protein
MPLRSYIDKLETLTPILEDTENKRQKVLDFMRHAPCICFLKNADTGKYEFANAAMCEALNKTENEVIGKTDYELLSLDEAKISTNHDLEVLAEKKELITIRKVKGKVYLVAKFLVVNGGTSIGGFGIEFPENFKLVYSKEE